MANGWKPKKGCKVSLNNVFSINYDQYVVDEIAKELYKNKRKYKETLAYLGTCFGLLRAKKEQLLRHP